MVGPAARGEVIERCRQSGWHRLWIVIDRHVARTPIVTQMVEEWSRAGLEIHQTLGPRREPTYDDLEELRGSFPATGADVVLGVGGGSTIDTAKGLAVLATNHEPAHSYRGFEQFSVAPLPNIAIPTIAGSGAEVTPNASFVDSTSKRKLGINGAGVRPIFAVLDPELTAGAPPEITAATGFDALVHSIEAFTSRRSTPIARDLACRAVALVSSGLVAVYKREITTEVRQDLLVGAALAALAMTNSGTGAAAALSYPTGTRLGIAHGLAGAIFLPEVVAFNISHGVETYADLVDHLASFQEGKPQRNRSERAAAFAERLRALRDRLGLKPPTRISVDGNALDNMCADVGELQAALDSNAADFTIDDARRMFTQVFRNGVHAS